MAKETRFQVEISKKQQTIVFFVWLLVVPISAYIAYAYFPSRTLDWPNLLLLFGLMFLTMLLPLRFSNVTISLERWITFTIFFQYGVFAEFIFVQIAMIVLLFSEKSGLPITHKFLVNSTIFASISVVSGFVFHFAGGTVGSLDFSELFIFGFLYAIVYSFLNNLLLKLYFTFNSRTYSLHSEGALWDYISTLIMVPFSITFYFLSEHLGAKSLVLIGGPFLIVLAVLRMYNTSNTLNDQLSSAKEIGHELADMLLFDQVMETFLKKLKAVVSFQNAYVVDLQSGRKLLPLMGFEKDVITKQVEEISFLADKNRDDGISIYETKIYRNRQEIKAVKTIDFLHYFETLMVAPIIRNDKTEGFLILTSTRKNAFTAINVQIIDILTGYLAISLEKARYFEKTIAKSERCGLTKLHNFRYLDKELDKKVIQFHLGEIEKLSVIILDIDYFKKINDTFGHESGNDLLVKLADLLRKHSAPKDILARYGGEEFVFVMPNCDKVTASKRAEKIRQEVEATVFTINPDLSENRSLIDVQMNVSLGVATMPDDADSSLSLMRNADRALYIGGKQAGRNKVGVFETQEEIETEPLFL